MGRYDAIKSGPVTIQAPDDFWTTALKTYQSERDRVERLEKEDRVLKIQEAETQNSTTRAEAAKQNADTQEYSSLASFWQGEIDRARPDQRASIMRAANLDFEEKLPGQTNPYTQDIINNEVEYSTDYQDHIDVFTGTSGQNLDDVDKALTFFSQDPARNAHILSQLRNKKEKLVKTESNKASLDLISGLVTQYLPKNTELAKTINTIKNKELITDSMLTNISSVVKQSVATETQRMKNQVELGKITKENYKNYADSLREIGLGMMDTNPEAGQAYIDESLKISAGLPYLNIGGSKAKDKDEPGLGFKTAADIAEKYTTEQKGYISNFEKKIRDSVGEESRINIDGKNISGKEFLKNLDDGRYSDDEILGASIMDKNLPTGRILAANKFKNETVYDAAGNEYKISKFEQSRTPFKGAGFKRVDLGKKINYITVTKDGKKVTFTDRSGKEKEKDKLTLEEFNSLFSLEKPGVTFESKRKEEGVLSPKEYPALREEAEKYAVSLGFKDELTVEEKKDILNKVYEKYPQLK